MTSVAGEKHVFFASTPFNVLTSAMVALSLPTEDQAHLILIDQIPETAPFREALAQWKTSPFVEIHSISDKSSGISKRRARLNSFKDLDVLLKKIQPQWLYTGNDRRIEFQYSMAHCNGKGVYLDDGTYTYLGRPTHWFADHIVDNLMKKLAYGFWWRQPPAIGASSWITKSILAYPENALEILKQRPCESLPRNMDNPAFQELSQLCITDARELSNLTSLLLLPHSSAAANIKTALAHWQGVKGSQPGYKHHPRTEKILKTGPQALDFWSLPNNAFAVPASMPLEIILPMLPANCVVIGDVSTALLTAKWLRPELSVSACVNASTSQEWINLLDIAGVKLISSDQNPVIGVTK
ncbi:MAG: hypothetical protein P1U57_08830 [Oleibacter sp.]|nr:hypothetical protein [Thalassolituus sp.]